MYQLRGQHSLEPCDYKFVTDSHGFTTLTYNFENEVGDGEQLTTTMTYPNKLRSKIQVYCGKHIAYTSSMLCSCPCAVKQSQM